MRKFDYIVIGGGSGGLASAQRAASYGASVALFEPKPLGGTCVNVGCVPKKVMWNAAELASALDHAQAYGFDLHVDGHDWAKLKRGRDAYVARLNGIYERNLAARSITVLRSLARFRGAAEVADASGAVYGADHVLIATGGAPIVPHRTGADLGTTSDGFFELESRPDRVALVGSGYVAVELAGVLRALGSEVTIFARGERVLRSFDEALGQRLTAALRSSGVAVVTAAVPERLEGTPGQVVLGLVDGRRFGAYDTLIWAIGRAPSTASLGLHEAGVEVTPDGYVEVDEWQNTSAAGVYAVGDVTGLAELTPVAIAAGRRLADRLFGGQPDRRLRYEMIPTVVFSHPPIGTIGLTEHEARERHADQPVKIYESEFVPMFFALTDAKPKTFMKLVTVGTDERVVGCHVIGPGADEMTQGFAVALTMGARKRDLDDTIAIHPTSAEELVTMR